MKDTYDVGLLAATQFLLTCSVREHLCQVMVIRSPKMAKYVACISFRQGAGVRGERMFRLPDTIRSTHNQDGGIVLDIQQGQMFSLNFVGSRIVELLKSGSTESAIVADISREFDVTRDLAETDVREFIQRLRKHGLIEE